MRGIRRFIAASIAVSIAASAAHAQKPLPSADSLDIGVRYWLSSGATERSIDATSQDPSFLHPAAEVALNPSITTNYEQLDANIVELFARKRFDEQWFAKGTAGLGKINSGTLIDETFFSIGGQPFHTMTLSAVDGKLGYATFDIGRDLTKGREAAFGVFVGYQYWTEKVDAHGVSDAFGPGGLAPNVLYATNEITWHALRLGGEFRVTRGRTRLIIEGAWIPYAGYRNESTFHLSTIPDTTATGHGRGGTFDAELRRSFPQLGGIDIGIGVRYWKLNAYNGNETFGSSLSLPIVNLESFRHGLTFTVAKNW
jgi:hypothetical protein